MKILVTGANGQLGNEMRLVAARKAEYIFTDVVAQEGVQTTILDITDLEAVRKLVQAEGVEAIVNCAAYTNVDAAESNEALAEKLNADAPANLARVMAEVGGLLVQISTDYVFGKEPYNRPCRENQEGTPTGVYGMTKLHGEQRVMQAGCDYVIIRTAWLYSEFGKNFCKTMLNLTATKPSLKVVFDQVGTPTYALDLAKAIDVILTDYAASRHEVAGCETSGHEASEHEASGHEVSSQSRPKYSKSGIYHFSNEGVCSWYDFTKMIQEFAAEIEEKEPKTAARASKRRACNVQPCHSNEFPSPVKRPAYSVLDKSKIKETFGVSVPYWTDSLKMCIKNILEAEASQII